jgi:hypothetical protein
MTTTPSDPASDEQNDNATPATPEKAGAEIGMVEGEGTTFEPEEDQEDESDG